MSMRRLIQTLAVAVLLPAALHGETNSKSVTFANEQWIKVGVKAEGLEVTEVRFKIEKGIHFNPLRAGIGPQVWVDVVNNGSHASDLAIAIALFDEKGILVGATESGHNGEIDPGEKAEIKMMFRELQHRILDAKTAHIAIETFR